MEDKVFGGQVSIIQRGELVVVILKYVLPLVRSVSSGDGAFCAHLRLLLNVFFGRIIRELVKNLFLSRVRVDTEKN